MARAQFSIFRRTGWGKRTSELLVAVSMFALALLAFTGVTTMALCQVTTSAITGFVTDSSGGTAAGAIVKIAEIRTSFIRTAIASTKCGTFRRVS
jgi:hypothetical protein